MKNCVKTVLLIASTCAFNLNAGQFTLASWNILAEWAYQDNAKTEIMPFKDPKFGDGRKTLLLKNLDKLASNTDIICLQEVDMRTGKEGSDIVKYLEKLKYTVVTPYTITSQATIIAYNNKFKGTNKHDITLKNHGGGGTKQCVSETLVFTDKKLGNLPSIKIISLHLPFELGDKQGTTEEYELVSLKHNVIAKKNTVGFTIICGDFNYKTYPDHKGNFLNYKNLVNQNYFDAQCWHDAGLKHGFNKIETAYSSGFERMDYIFYTPDHPFCTTKNPKNTLTCTDYRQAPDDLRRLIKHSPPHKGEGNTYLDFPSDHVLMIAEFKVK